MEVTITDRGGPTHGQHGFPTGHHNCSAPTHQDGQPGVFFSQTPAWSGAVEAALTPSLLLTSSPRHLVAPAPSGGGPLATLPVPPLAQPGTRRCAWPRWPAAGPGLWLPARPARPTLVRATGLAGHAGRPTAPPSRPGRPGPWQHGSQQGAGTMVATTSPPLSDHAHGQHGTDNAPTNQHAFSPPDEAQAPSSSSQAWPWSFVIHLPVRAHRPAL